MQVAASYIVGGVEQAAGGDWFEVLPRPDGSVAAVVGDVVDHAAAAAVMAQLRAVALERLHAGADPVQVVTALDRFTHVVPAAASATVCVPILDPSTGDLHYCAAGHPPPLVVDPQGTARYLDPSGAPPLHDPARNIPGRAGTHQPARCPDGRGTGAAVHRRHHRTSGCGRHPAGTVQLAQTAAAADPLMPVFILPTAAERVAVQTLERLTRIIGSSDDITLLALHPVTPLADLELQLHLTRTALPTVRAEVRGGLGVRQVTVNGR